MTVFNPWYVLKFSYTDKDGKKLAGIQAHAHFNEAKDLFDQLQLGYRFGRTIRVKSGDMIAVTGAWLYSSSEYYEADALKAVEMGKATLMYRATGTDLDLKEATATLDGIQSKPR